MILAGAPLLNVVQPFCRRLDFAMKLRFLALRTYGMDLSAVPKSHAPVTLDEPDASAHGSNSAPDDSSAARVTAHSGWHRRNLPSRCDDYLGSRSSQQRHPHQRSTADTVAPAKEHKENHFTEPLAMNDVAKKAGCSRAHLLLVFKGETGMSPNDWRQRRRVKFAIELLRTTHRKLVEIANATGFSSASTPARRQANIEKITNGSRPGTPATGRGTEPRSGARSRVTTQPGIPARFFTR